ncbi:MAG: hypothetical protein GY756_20860 [bacterium]|nr:hypothetical protein [bacterium]
MIYKVNKTIQENGPYLLGGHSSGGLVVFDVCRHLLNKL